MFDGTSHERPDTVADQRKADITQFRRTDGKPAGKIVRLLPNGTVDKSTAPHVGDYQAAPVFLSAESAQAALGDLAALLQSLESSEGIILGYENAERQTYHILPAKKLDKDPAAVARLKINYQPGRVLVCDFDPDPDCPHNWATISQDERWRLLTGAIPEWAGAAHLIVPSSSGRVQMPDGTPAFTGGGGCHVYLVMESAPKDRAELDAIRRAVERRLMDAGLSWVKTCTDGSKDRRYLIDTSVIDTAREIFAGPPSVGTGLRLTDWQGQLHPGGFAGVPVVEPVTAKGTRDGGRSEIRDLMGGGSKFWDNVRQAAIDSHTALSKWVPALLPTAHLQGHGNYRLRSTDLGRDLEEDISIVSKDAALGDVGIWDFGTREPLTAIDLVMRLKPATEAEAAHWLCRQLGIDPASLGWVEQTQTKPSADPDDWADPIPLDYKLPPVPAFDAEALLPEAVREYVTDGAERMSCPPEFIAGPLLVAMSAALGNKVRICPKARDTGWRVSANLWGAIVARPGFMKSPALSYATAPLKRFEDELTRQNDARRERYRFERIQYDAQMAQFKAGFKNGTSTQANMPREPEEPMDARLIVHDSTVAKLGELLVGSPHGVIVIRDEITGWLYQLGAEGHEGDREFYLVAWEGWGSYKIDRIKRGSTEIKNVCVSMVGAIQPGKLAEYVRATNKGGAGDDGLLQRFQVTVFPDMDNEWKLCDRPPNLDAMSKCEAAFKRLWDVNPTAIGANSDLNGEEHWLHFTNEAQVVFNAQLEKIVNKAQSGDMHLSLQSHLNKYRSLVPSIALILHIANGGTGPVTKDALVRAIRWSGYLFAHAKRVYAGAANGAEMAAQLLAKRVGKGDLGATFTLRDIYRRGWAGLSEKADAEAAVEILLEHGYARELPQEKGAGRMRRFAVNPKVWRPLSALSALSVGGQ